MSTTVALTVHLTLDSDRDIDNLLQWIANGSIRPAITDDWMSGGANLAGYEGPLVESVTISHNGIEIN